MRAVRCVDGQWAQNCMLPALHKRCTASLYKHMPCVLLCATLQPPRAGFFGGVGVPVSAATFKWATEPVPFLAAASIGSTLVVTVVLLRLYLGWSFVGNRLLSATVEYEETGWYDGQVWVKTPQVLMRDRLLNNYTVLPAMRRIRRSLLASSAACVTSVLLLQSSAHADAVEQAVAEAQRGGRASAPARCDDCCHSLQVIGPHAYM